MRLSPDTRIMQDSTVCINSIYSVTEGEDVNGAEKFCVQWAVSFEQFAINSAGQQFVSESVQRAAKGVSLQSWTIRRTPSGAAGTFCDRGAVYKRSDLFIYPRYSTFMLTFTAGYTSEFQS